MKIKIKKLSELAIVPLYATVGSAGADLVSVESKSVYPGHTVTVGCGFSLEIPEGFEAQIRPRSGLAKKHGITILNSPGTIDSDYRGEIKVMLHNTGDDPFIISPGDRIAQMVIAPVIQADFEIVDVINETERGAGGFGSTGK